jgi:hypothetical protein
MIQIGEAVYFHKLNMKVTTTICEKTGDFFGDNPLSRIGFSAGNYVRRHYVTSGSFKASYPGTQYEDEIDTVGCVWPYEDHKEVDNYVVTALEDNSAFHCFLPIGAGRQIVHEFYSAKKGQKFVAKQGKVYSPAVDYYVNGSLKKAFSLLACSDNDATIELAKGGKIAAFYATTL